jgi:hypothetical protein
LPSTELKFINNDPANALTVCFTKVSSPVTSPLKTGDASITVPGDGGSRVEKVHEKYTSWTTYKYKKSEDGGCSWSEGPSEGGMTGTVEVASGGGQGDDPPGSTR